MARDKVKIKLINQTANEAYLASHCSIAKYNFTETSDANGRFTNHPAIYITIASGSERPVTGFSATFDQMTDTYPTEVTVRYIFTDNTFVDDEVHPNSPDLISDCNSSKYCKQVIIDIARINRPFSTISYTDIYFGEVYEYTTAAIVELTVTKSADLTGVTAPYYTFNGIFVSGSGLGLSSTNTSRFTVNISTRSDFYSKNIGDFYIDKIDHVGGKMYSISGFSALGKLAKASNPGFDFQGGVYTTTAISQICGGVISPQTAWATGDEAMTWGIIPEGGDLREALAQIALGHMRYLDGNGEFRTVATSGFAQDLTDDVYTDELIYAYPRVNANESMHRLTLNTYDDDTDLTPEHRQINAAGKNKPVCLRDNSSAVRTGSRDVTINAYCLATTEVLASSHYTATFNLLKSLYARNRVWHGRIMWDGADEVGNTMGQRVIVPTQGGGAYGNITSAVLRFSGASVSAEIDVLLDQTW